MKKTLVLLAGVVLLVFSGCSSGASSEKKNEDSMSAKEVKPVKESFTFTEKIPVEGALERFAALEDDTFSNVHTGTSFAIFVQPLDDVNLLMSNLDEYYQKRYSDAQIVDNFKSSRKEILMTTGGGLPMFVLLFHKGGYFDNSSLTVDDKFYEFFFLENEKGEFVSAKGQYTEDLLINELTNVNTPIQLFISFPETEVEKLMEGAEKLYLTFDGLNISSEDRIELKYPFINYYLEDFPELETMMSEIEEAG